METCPAQLGAGHRIVLVLFLAGLLALTAFSVFRSSPPAPVRVSDIQPVRQFDGKKPDGKGYQQPRGLSITRSGNLLVTDFRNYRVQEVSASGRILNEWGSHGTGPGRFNDPTCAAMDAEGGLYVVDTWNQRVQKRTPDGEWIANWAQYDRFWAPRGIAIDAENRVYVANTSAHTIVVFDRAGRHLATWGERRGRGLPQFKNPVGLAMGPDGNVYVADTGNQRVLVVSPEGKIVSSIPVEDWSSSQFQEAYPAVGKDGRVYVTLPLKCLIQVYDPKRKAFLRFGRTGATRSRLDSPTGIAIDRAGAVYVSDTAHDRVLKYAPLSSGAHRAEAAWETSRTRPSVLFIVFILTGSLAFLLLSPANRRFFRYRAVLSRLRSFPVWRSPILYGLALLLVAGALILFADRHPDAASACILAALLFFVLHALPEPYETSILSAQARSATSGKTAWRFWLGLSVIAVIAFVLRVYKLDSIPWGINNDVAWEGSFARRFLDGAPFTIFTPEAWGKETLYMYMVALSFKLFGVSKFTLVLPSILAGTLTSAAVFVLCRKVFHEGLAFLSGLFYAVMAWAIVFARTGYRSTLAPLCVVLTAYFYFLAVDTERRGRKLICFAASGLCIGIGLNTYFSFRGIPLMMVLLGIQTWIATPRFLKRNGWGLVTLLVAATIAFAPLGLYAIHNWDVFMGRSNFLFVGHKISQAGSWRPLWDSLCTNILTLYYKAKVGNFFNNDIPILSRILAFFVTLGFGCHVRHAFKRGPLLVLLIFGFGMLPAVLSEPDGSRSLIATVSLAILAATGVWSLAVFLAGLTVRRVFHGALLVAGLGVICAETYLYFGVLGNDAGAQFGYARKHTLIGYKGLALSKDYQVYISQGHFIDTPKFLCYGLPGDVFGITRGEVIHYVPADELTKNLRRILNTPVPPQKGLAFVFENTPENTPLFEEVRKMHPNGIRKDYTDDRYGDTVIFYTYEIPPKPDGRQGEAHDP
jgi:DNA-binding beta-propeller fold protein YncE